MPQIPEPDETRLAAAREGVQSFIEHKRRWTRAMFWAGGTAELVFFALMLVFMDFSDSLYWFLFFGLMLVYTPLLLFVWRNAHMIDMLFYRLVDELKYGKGDE
jgi:hypothetical protein